MYFICPLGTSDREEKMAGTTCPRGQGCRRLIRWCWGWRSSIARENFSSVRLEDLALEAPGEKAARVLERTLLHSKMRGQTLHAKIPLCHYPLCYCYRVLVDIRTSMFVCWQEVTECIKELGQQKEIELITEFSIKYSKIFWSEYFNNNFLLWIFLYWTHLCGC